MYTADSREVPSRGMPGGIELLQAVHKDVQEDMADASTAGELVDGQVLAAAVQHLTVAHSIAVQ